MFLCNSCPPDEMTAATTKDSPRLRLRHSLRLPVIVAPMFLISGPDLVIAACRAGVIGCFPAPNARSIEILEEWCERIAAQTKGCAAWSLNILAHSTYKRFDDELAVVARHRPPLVITALGSPARVTATVHGYGGLVFSDVAQPVHARKAIDAGADGLVLVCSGAGGHTGKYNPFAFIADVRQFWSGPIVLSGGITNARSIIAAEVLGADFAYMGTRFIASQESLGDPARKAMTVEVVMEDIVTSAAVTGVPANWMLPSLRAAGFTDEQIQSTRKSDFSSAENAKPWKNIWGAGQGVGAVTRIESTAAIVEGIEAEYRRLLPQGLQMRQ